MTTKEEDGNLHGGGDGDGMDVEANGSVTKRTRRLSYPGTVMEITRQVLSEVGEEVQGMNLE